MIMTTDVTTQQLLPTTRIWELDALHSSVQFAVRHHVIATYRAEFTDFEAQYDGNRQSIVGSVRVGSVRVAFPELYAELMSDVFFDAQQHPTITFVSTAMEADGKRLSVTGDLSMKGITRSVRAEGSVDGTSLVNEYDGTAHDHFGMELDLTIDRREFGVDHNNTLLDGRINLGWDVTVHFSLEFSSPAGLVESGRFVPSPDIDRR
jgi:polyisoprenoid-binding protein YceI